VWVDDCGAAGAAGGATVTHRAKSDAFVDYTVHGGGADGRTIVVVCKSCRQVMTASTSNFYCFGCTQRVPRDHIERNFYGNEAYMMRQAQQMT
jgi:hypothetical protein